MFVQGLLFPIVSAVVIAIVFWAWNKFSKKIELSRIVVSNLHDTAFSIDFTLINRTNQTILIDEIKLEKIVSEKIQYKSKAATSITIDLEEDAYISVNSGSLSLPRHQKVLPNGTEREVLSLRSRSGDWFGIFHVSARQDSKPVISLGKIAVFFLGKNTTVDYSSVSENGFQELSASPVMTEGCRKFLSLVLEHRLAVGKSNR